MSDDRVIPLRTVTKPVSDVDDLTVAHLEQLLEKAKKGEINGIAVVTMKIDGAGSFVVAGTSFEGEGVRQAIHATIGTVEYLKYRLITERLEPR